MVCFRGAAGRIIKVSVNQKKPWLKLEAPIALSRVSHIPREGYLLHGQPSLTAPPLHDTSRSVLCGGGVSMAHLRGPCVLSPMSPFSKLYLVGLDYNTVFTLVCIFASAA